MGSEATGVRGGGLGKIQAGLEQEAWRSWGRPAGGWQEHLAEGLPLVF